MGVYARHVYYDIMIKRWGCMPDMSNYDIFVMKWYHMHIAYCVSDVALLSRCCRIVGRCLCCCIVMWSYVDNLWCEVMLIICDGCVWNNDADVILWFKLLSSLLWIMYLLLLNVNLTPSVEIAALWTSADNQE